MPLIHRAMRAEGNLPLVGHEKGDTLGVREKIMKGDKEEGDIKPVNGMVHPGTGGMSVAPGKADLPPHLIPKQYRDKYPDARRSKPDAFPWRMGEGEFQAGPLCDGLQLRPEDTTHGFVEPDKAMPLHEYRGAIEATRAEWIKEPW